MDTIVPGATPGLADSPATLAESLKRTPAMRAVAGLAGMANGIVPLRETAPPRPGLDAAGPYADTPAMPTAPERFPRDAERAVASDADGETAGQPKQTSKPKPDAPEADEAKPLAMPETFLVRRMDPGLPLAGRIAGKGSGMVEVKDRSAIFDWGVDRGYPGTIYKDAAKETYIGVRAIGPGAGKGAEPRLIDSGFRVNYFADSSSTPIEVTRNHCGIQRNPQGGFRFFIFSEPGGGKGRGGLPNGANPDLIQTMKLFGYDLQRTIEFGEREEKLLARDPVFKDWKPGDVLASLVELDPAYRGVAIGSIFKDENVKHAVMYALDVRYGEDDILYIARETKQSPLAVLESLRKGSGGEDFDTLAAERKKERLDNLRKDMPEQYEELRRGLKGAVDKAAATLDGVKPRNSAGDGKPGENAGKAGEASGDAAGAANPDADASERGNATSASSAFVMDADKTKEKIGGSLANLSGELKVALGHHLNARQDIGYDDFLKILPEMRPLDLAIANHRRFRNGKHENQWYKELGFAHPLGEMLYIAERTGKDPAEIANIALRDDGKAVLAEMFKDAAKHPEKARKLDEEKRVSLAAEARNNFDAIGERMGIIPWYKNTPRRLASRALVYETRKVADIPGDYYRMELEKIEKAEQNYMRFLKRKDGNVSNFIFDNGRMLSFSHADLKRIDGAKDPKLEMGVLIKERKEQALKEIQCWEQEKSKFEKVMTPPPSENRHIQMGEDVISAAALAAEAYVMPQSKIFDTYNDANDFDKKILRPLLDNWDDKLTIIENLEKNKNLIGWEATKMIFSKILPMAATDDPRGRAATESLFTEIAK